MRLGARRGESTPFQRGFALIALLALAALISAFVIASTLNFTSAGISNEREDRSMSALRKAKAALIAYAANEQWQLYKSQATDQPGALPCPDTDNNGASQLSCPNALDRVGRLPYSTIGADDLRDASGERLWYALSSNFRKLSGTTVINSDTQGLLTVTGTAPASNVVAIVFAPGPPVQDSTLPPGQIQDRSPANINRPASYLEGFTVGANDYTFTTNALPTDTFNDRLLVITQADLMAAVEPVVAARIERDVKPAIQAYSAVWNNAFPFAVPFAAVTSATQSAYTGQVGESRGLLPITNSPTLLSWRPSSIQVQQINGGTGSLASVPPTNITWSCSTPTSPPPPTQFTCLVNYPGGSDDRPAIQMQAVLENAALSFPKALTYTDASMLDVDDNPVTVYDPAFGQWSGSNPPFFYVTVDHLPAADGSGLVRFRGRLQNAGTPPGGTGGQVRITVSVPGYMSITNSADPTMRWFIANQWYRQTYYAVSPGYAPGGVPPGATCIPAPGTPSCCNPLPTVVPTPSCLTVNNLRPVAPASCTPGNPSADPCSTVNKQALLILAGRALDGSSRPSGNVANYLENANLAAALNPSTLFVFEHRTGVPTSINDRVVVVSP